jgi:hypothetical protein
MAEAPKPSSPAAVVRRLLSKLAARIRMMVLSYRDPSMAMFDRHLFGYRGNHSSHDCVLIKSEGMTLPLPHQVMLARS